MSVSPSERQKLKHILHISSPFGEIYRLFGERDCDADGLGNGKVGGAIIYDRNRICVSLSG